MFDKYNFYHKSWEFGNAGEAYDYEEGGTRIIPKHNLAFNISKKFQLEISICFNFTSYDFKIGFLMFNFIAYGFFKKIGK